MDIEQIKELMDAMAERGTKRLAIKRKDYEIELERDCPHYSVSHIASPAAIEPAAAQTISTHITASDSSENTTGVHVTSPMVGTFYSSPAPEEPAFVKVGDKVDPETIVCIIEAMKVMNEVKAGASGVIKEILVDNGHPVEFGTKLFRVV